jgi:hydroxyacylglutathione hydrolase
MRIIPVACLKDNYAYLVVCDETNECAVVDPSEAAPVLAAIEAAKVTPVAIWNTHHHMDHVGGNEDLLVKMGSIREVSAHASDRGRVPGQTRFLETGDEVSVGTVRARITHVPGHTLGAVSYFIDRGEGDRAVFTGDTLFLAGCGRLFEGTPAQMHTSMAAFAALPPDTKVYCGHEYTASNLRFAKHVEPENTDVARTIDEVSVTREAGRPTVPGTIAGELATNPFMRAKSVEELAERRKAKDDFK